MVFSHPFEKHATEKLDPSSPRDRGETTKAPTSPQGPQAPISRSKSPPQRGRSWSEMNPSPKLTAKAPEHRPGPKRKRSYSNHPWLQVRAISFREGISFSVSPAHLRFKYGFCGMIYVSLTHPQSGVFPWFCGGSKTRWWIEEHRNSRPLLPQRCSSREKSKWTNWPLN